MNAKQYIDASICKQVEESLAQIEKEHDVTILQAIESGSRAWGFPSPDSDYDVRFIYAHSRDWYLQLSEERDVIELPISDELDIAGWDLRKALNLANKGNAVIQEWMISPIVYQQSDLYVPLSNLVSKSFNSISTYHHYRAMAKKAYLDMEQSGQKKLKRFFYFARSTLSAQWIVDHQTMPSIVFSDLIEGLMTDQEQTKSMRLLIEKKAQESEKSNLDVPTDVFEYVVSRYQGLKESITFEKESKPLLNEDFRDLVNMQSTLTQN